MTIGSRVEQETKGGEKRGMNEVAYMLIGIGAGIAWYRYFIIHTISKIPRTMCDYCQFEIHKRQIFKRKK